MTNRIDNSDEIINSCQVIARIAELESFAEGEESGIGEGEAAELMALRALACSADALPDWNHGVILIRESHFVDYGRLVVQESVAGLRERRWLLDCIDWDEAADRLRADYAEVDFDGVTYLTPARSRP